VSTTPALLVAAAGVGVGHAVLPDHWAPLAVVGRANQYPLAKVARLSGLAGVAHVAVSVVLGAIVVAVGLQFRSGIEHAQDTIVGALLIATAGALLVQELRGRGHAHDHGHDHVHDHAHRSRAGSLAAVMVPFGAAASPDLTILPVFLGATSAGVGTAIGSLVIFAMVTIVTIVGLTLAATAGGYQIRGEWLGRYGNALTAGVLIVIGALVLAGLL
jgi:nickel/cobalt transporter (NicO) family protein